MDLLEGTLHIRVITQGKMGHSRVWSKAKSHQKEFSGRGALPHPQICHRHRDDGKPWTTDQIGLFRLAQLLGTAPGQVWPSDLGFNSTLTMLGWSGTSAPMVSDRKVTREQPLRIKCLQRLDKMQLKCDSRPRAPMELLTGLEPKNPQKRYLPWLF